MRGYVDRLMCDLEAENTNIVIDLKSGSRTPETPIQLATYSVQLEPLINAPCTWGAFYDARKGVMHDPIPLEEWTEEKLGYIYGTLDRAIEAGIFLPNITNMCKGCGVRKFCVYQGGREDFDLAA